MLCIIGNLQRDCKEGGGGILPFYGAKQIKPITCMFSR